MMLLVLGILVAFGVLMFAFLLGVRIGTLTAERNMAMAELKDLRKQNGLG